MKPGKIYWTFIGICFILISLWAGICEQDRVRVREGLALSEEKETAGKEAALRKDSQSALVVEDITAEDVVPPELENHRDETESGPGQEPSGQSDIQESGDGSSNGEPGGRSDIQGSGDGSTAGQTEGRIPAEELPPRVAITFDDGPHPKYTPMLLDGLKERDVRATFFLIGENIPGNEEIVKRMAEEGHLIGNHTYSHVKVTDLSQERACEEITKTSALVREITGRDTEYIRPPFGEWDKSLECGIPLFPVLWNVDTLDWTTKSVSDVVRRGTADIEDGDVILLHDCYDSSVKAALQIIDFLQGKGFEFVTADEMILQ